jgi:hypothetical protein
MIKVQHPSAEKLANLINWHYLPVVAYTRGGIVEVVAHDKYNSA